MRTMIVLAVTAALALTPAVPAAAAGYRQGEYITVRGRVVDLEGRPVPGVTVLLEPSRREFKLFQRKKNREQTDRLQVPTETDDAGEYTFEWRWDPFYDTFELAIATPSVSGAQKSYEVLHRTDFTDRMMASSPVVVELEVEDPSRFSGSRRWMPPPVTSTEVGRRTEGEPSSLGSTDDERRILNEMGRPDQVDSHQRLAGIETSWWYFEDGKVYHFLDGKLGQVMHFDPVP